MSPANKQPLVIAGLEVNIYSAAPITAGERNPKEIAVIFLLHGRYGSAEAIDPIARSVIDQTKNNRRDLLIVTFDQRNHGKRIVDPKGNDAWSKDKIKHNERHAVDMYAIQTGTARDVSLLVDFLPSFLYPNNESHNIVEWGVAGISLGGHATWITLANDKRVRTGIPIIGCPDYNKLIALRAQQVGVALEGPTFPKSFKGIVETLDPPFLIKGAENPFLGKRVLVLSGEADQLVPWEASKEFVLDKLDVGKEGVKTVSLYRGVGHECTDAMVQEMAEFIAKHCL
ncbi:hypothetical protein D9615_004190 [Tricholomella constricta]|uniref:Uncharacterized protein n=1 Tax=Tricholomella constricta TaxID=117010 RepID=A0A8H5HEK7_9AGAR|nr:hypothetical protein D9615_004190 [Tricholomella constricta]